MAEYEGGLLAMKFFEFFFIVLFFLGALLPLLCLIFSSQVFKTFVIKSRTPFFAVLFFGGALLPLFNLIFPIRFFEDGYGEVSMPQNNNKTSPSNHFARKQRSLTLRKISFMSCFSYQRRNFPILGLLFVF